MILKGRVATGRGYARTVLPEYLDELGVHVPFRPYPGTLNVFLDRPVCLTSSLEWRGPDDGFERILVPARIRGIDVFINRWTGCPYYRIDLIAPVYLRDELSLQDGSPVEVLVDRSYLDSLPRVALVEWTLFRIRTLLKI